MFFAERKRSFAGQNTLARSKQEEGMFQLGQLEGRQFNNVGEYSLWACNLEQLFFRGTKWGSID